MLGVGGPLGLGCANLWVFNDNSPSKALPLLSEKPSGLGYPAILVSTSVDLELFLSLESGSRECVGREACDRLKEARGSKADVESRGWGTFGVVSVRSKASSHVCSPFLVSRDPVIDSQEREGLTKGSELR